MSLDFSFSSEHEAVRDTVRRLCQEEMASLVVNAEENEMFPRKAPGRESRRHSSR
jgi:hypothetical protein